MKPLLSILSLFLIVLGLTSCAGHHLAMPGGMSRQELAKHNGDVTVALVRQDLDNEDDKVSSTNVYCSGVWISETSILTAHHCVESVRREAQEQQDKKESAGPKTCDLLRALLGGCSDKPVPHKVIALKDFPINFVLQSEVAGIGKTPTAQHLGHVVRWDGTKDLALVEMDGLVPAHEFAKVATELPQMTQPVHVVGHVKGFYWTYLEGTVSGYPKSIPHIKRSGPFLEVEAPIYFGNSGGGAFNDRGELMGIASFLLRQPGEGFFVSAENVKLFLDSKESVEAPKEDDD